MFVFRNKPNDLLFFAKFSGHFCFKKQAHGKESCDS